MLAFAYMWLIINAKPDDTGLSGTRHKAKLPVSHRQSRNKRNSARTPTFVLMWMHLSNTWSGSGLKHFASIYQPLPCAEHHAPASVPPVCVCVYTRACHSSERLGKREGL